MDPSRPALSIVVVRRRLIFNRTGWPVAPASPRAGEARHPGDWWTRPRTDPAAGAHTPGPPPRRARRAGARHDR
ncbi:hypothetical protein AB0I60_26280, partial [Actinosynnema sp. NPDC050436]|uniref:hypothetical protein n=1 Tax=Actinosynnema sp. NPDC050436 TaxID=3155659 RepID=UPI0033F65CF3